MQSSQVMPQSAVLPFYSGHRCFTDQMVSLLNHARVHLVTIGDVQKTSPTHHNLPQGLKGLQRVVAHYELEDAGMFGVDDCPQPDFVFF
jgi:hypothetical protein